MSRRPGASVVEPRRERFVRAFAAAPLGVGAQHLTSRASRIGTVTAFNVVDDSATAETETGEKTRELVERVADGQTPGLDAVTAHAPFPATAEAGDVLDPLTLPAHERVP